MQRRSPVRYTVPDQWNITGWLGLNQLLESQTFHDLASDSCSVCLAQKTCDNNRKDIREEAKIIGITPAVLTFNGIELD